MQLFNDSLALRAKDRKATVNSLHQLEALRTSPDNPAGIRYLTYLIRQYPLKELHVDLRTYTPNQNELDYNIEANRDLDVVQILFDHARPLKGCPFHYQLPLTKLKLWNVNLYLGTETWTKVIRAMSLEEVELSRCAWTGNFLIGLAKVQPRLEKVKIHYDRTLDVVEKAPANARAADMGSWLVNRFRYSLVAFLKTLAGGTVGSATPSKHGLKWLEVKFEHVESECFIDDDGITALHAPGLEGLAFDFMYLTGDDEEPYIHDGIIKALNACNPAVLRQLCMPIFDFMMHYSGLDFAAINPVTLMLVDWWDFEWLAPELKPTMQVFANRVLSRLLNVHQKALKLRVLALKSMDYARDNTKTGEKVEYFVRCEAIMMGRKQDLMTPVTYAGLKKYEKEIDILEPTPMVIGKYGRA